MRGFRFLALWLVVCMASVCSLGAEDLGVVSGVVRDAEGRSLAGVTLTLTAHQVPATAKQTSSGAGGEFRFSDLAPGEYTLTGELKGFATAVHAAVRVLHGVGRVKEEIVLSREAEGVPGVRPPLQFQASGIHGLIDPGGYSASANADAATGLLQGIADVKRTSRSIGLSMGKDWPCDLEPKLQKAQEAHPDQGDANRRLGQFYVAHGEPQKAIPLLKRAVQMDGSDRVARRFLGMAWLQGGQFEDARKLLGALAEEPGADKQAAHDRAEIRQLLARADEGSGMFQHAAQEYRKAVAEEPSEEGFLGLGYELILAGSPADALVALNEGKGKFSGSVALRICVGTAQFLLGHASEALRTFLEAAEADLGDARPYPFIVAASGVAGEEGERVRDSLEAFRERSKDDASANYLYAVVLSRESGMDLGRIESLLKRATELDPTLAKAHLQLADLYAQRNEIEGAVTEYEAAVRIAPGLSEAHYRLAMACKRLGRTDEAAREIAIFQQGKAGQKAGSGSEKINIAQFISVMDAPQPKGSLETQCTTLVR